MLIVTSRWLLNLIFNMIKALNGRNFSSQNFQPLFPPFIAIWKTLLQLMLAFLFITSVFYFKPLNLFWSQPNCDCIAYELIKYNQFQIIENKPDETAYLMLQTIENFSLKLGLVKFDICEINEYFFWNQRTSFKLWFGLFKNYLDYISQQIDKGHM